MKLYWLDHKGIGADLKMIREAEAVSLKRLAEDTGVAASHIWNLENGIKEMSLEKFFVICSRLAVPAGQLIAENIIVSQADLFNLALEEVKRSKLFEMDGRLEFLIAQYASAAAFVVCHYVLTPGADMPHLSFNFPSQIIEDTFGAVCFQIRADAGFRYRESVIASLVKSPLKVIDSLHLLTADLLKDYFPFIQNQIDKKVEPVGWYPKVEKVLPLLAERQPIMINIDPMMLGKLNREEAEVSRAAREKHMETMISGLRKTGNEGSSPKALEDMEKKKLTKDTEIRMLAGVKSPMKVLLGRLSRATQARGRKAALAKLLRIPASSVSDWLDERYEPSGEVTLRLLEWVEAEEAQQKTPGGAENAAKGETRSNRSKDETNKSGPIKS